ncbi:Hypothetical predicted protein [Mytilus galloprovincialis]|uniref:Transposase Helix-turn-helix domain-containing protein n=1 Tax=Mytilus galloprovincialis TaxID=29158 RepID=A0A8B6FDZ3_MYTGA|nr:Hypothetical predicted protein [Mytilus galloprovincialis]
MTYWRGPRRVANPLKYKANFRTFKRTLSLRQEFLLTLMKLRLGLLSEDLADRFGISTATVSSVFTTWIRVLYSKLGQFVSNPLKEVVRAGLPPSFKNKMYQDVRHIIDCTEVFIERPNNLKIQAVTTNTTKQQSFLLVSLHQE